MPTADNARPLLTAASLPAACVVAQIVNLACEMNVWRTIETLLTQSCAINDAAADGTVKVQPTIVPLPTCHIGRPHVPAALANPAVPRDQVVGAMYDTETGQVSFMGEHPSQSLLLQMTPSNNAVRTADSPPVPVEEAVTMLYSVKLASHRRWEGRRVRGHPGHPYVARRGTRATRRVEVASPAKLSVLAVSLHTAHEMVTCPSAPAAPVGYIGDTQKMMTQLSKDGQNPVAVVIGCADSRAPIELLFDMRPGDLFVLRNAGNACKPGPGMLVGSAEYAIINLRTKLIVVAGHTKCGAVTAAVEAVRRNADMAEVTGSIGACLMEIVEAAKMAIDELPNASTAEQVQRATEYNVMNTIRKLILNSDVLYNSLNLGELQVHGAVFDIFSGRIKWLGQHPDLEKIIDEAEETIPPKKYEPTNAFGHDLF